MQAEATTAHGRVRGAVEDGIAVFRGIPYAAPPQGADRFGAPRPVEPWTGVREAVEYGPTAPHPPYLGGLADALPERRIPGADYLNLNVWTPGTGERGLPVLVYIHGGAFTNGSGAEPAYDAAAFARDGVVAVTFNYRLGAEGFARVEGAPDNRGLLDQIAALEWVRDNIAAFGGDPARVTVFGESAGAMSVVTLMAIPRARALFHRAIAQSGAGHTVQHPEDADRIAAALAERLGVPATPDGLAGVPVKALLEEQVRIDIEIRGRGGGRGWGPRLRRTGALPFAPVVDGELLPQRPVEALRAGEGAGIDLLIGTTSEEYRLFLVPPGILPAIGADRLAAEARVLGLPEEAAAVYAEEAGGAPGDAYCALCTDAVFRIPAYRALEARAAAGGGRSHAYEFTWRSPRFDGALGACHALEIPFVFDNLADGRTLAGPEAPQALADAMHRAWIDFATTGDPGWPEWDPAERVFMRFDHYGAGTVRDPGARTRLLWEGLAD
ncbi:carboxylesterase family protein [Streptomonospora sp. S1-112]|uniref:Carboxylic ester hydrolase n=1 Tax=Streptomonospora mangrovi TaxID=2883123 RepID=A0A9X3SEY3_9ACTN|nr:carboxylesterase family protein [Streptomonospora mangrovi]MDA0566338.1 carboxylesterase family protein [Streptomonospora mangrovi]